MPYALAAFISGFAATLIFHQGLFALLHSLGAVPYPVYSMAPTAPLGIPAVFSLAFWGGVWGLILWPLVGAARGASFWIRCIVIGALGPSLVALLLVFPLKGQAFAAGGDIKIWVGALLLNGAWGLGLGLGLTLLPGGRSSRALAS